jgi:hypothetical protein
MTAASSEVEPRCAASTMWHLMDRFVVVGRDYRTAPPSSETCAIVRKIFFSAA